MIINESITSVNESLSLNDIRNAKYSSSFMGDRAEIVIDGKNFVKIGKNKWEYSPDQPHALPVSYSDAEVYKYASNSKNVKLLESYEKMVESISEKDKKDFIETIVKPNLKRGVGNKADKIVNKYAKEHNLDPDELMSLWYDAIYDLT